MIAQASIIGAEDLERPDLTECIEALDMLISTASASDVFEGAQYSGAGKLYGISLLFAIEQTCDGPNAKFGLALVLTTAERSDCCREGVWNSGWRNISDNIKARPRTNVGGGRTREVNQSPELAAPMSTIGRSDKMRTHRLC
jgi:hypothetical protein